MQVFVAQEFLADIERTLELHSCLAHYLFPRALNRQGVRLIRARSQSETIDREDAAYVPCLPNCSRGTLRQNWNCETLVSAHSVSM